MIQMTNVSKGYGDQGTVKALIDLSFTVEQGERVLHPLRTRTTPMFDQIQTMPYAAVQSIVENFNPRGMRNYWKMVYLKELSDETIGIMTEMYARVPAPLTHIVLYTLGGSLSRVAVNETAVAYRDARHAVLAIGMWDDPAQDGVNMKWVREFSDAMQPFASGGFYPNYDTEAEEERLITAFGPEKHARLAAVKRKYDPENVFHMNQNIRPAGAPGAF